MGGGYGLLKVGSMVIVSWVRRDRRKVTSREFLAFEERERSGEITWLKLMSGGRWQKSEGDGGRRWR